MSSLTIRKLPASSRARGRRRRGREPRPLHPVRFRRLGGVELGGRILGFGTEAAAPYAQIAAIARANGAAITARNVADFADCGVAVVGRGKP